MNLRHKQFRIPSVFILWVILIIWAVAFFPKWYFISYTKIRELRDLMGAPLSEQRVRLHTPEIAVMNEVMAWYKQQSEPTTIVIPPVGVYPQLSVAQLWSAVAAAEKLDVKMTRPLLLEHVQGNVVFFVPAPTRIWNPTVQACYEKGCECPRAENITPIYWEVL